jgi:predicted DCC family thiol-disulfide oxidoreductase YuxK
MADFAVEVFYDGACPLCMREIRMLSRRDHHGRIRFTDISADGFDAGAVGLSWETLMGRIHGRLPDGTIIEGLEVSRRLYAAVGFSALATLSRAPGISQLLDLAYRLFAKNRLRLTGRCGEGACEVHPGHPTVRFPTGSRRITLDGLRPMGQGSPALAFPSKAGQTAQSGASGGTQVPEILMRGGAAW